MGWKKITQCIVISVIVGIMCFIAIAIFSITLKYLGMPESFTQQVLVTNTVEEGDQTITTITKGPEKEVKSPPKSKKRLVTESAAFAAGLALAATAIVLFFTLLTIPLDTSGQAQDEETSSA